jgi:hypothetical protein
LMYYQTNRQLADASWQLESVNSCQAKTIGCLACNFCHA